MRIRNKHAVDQLNTVLTELNHGLAHTRSYYYSTWASGPGVPGRGQQARVQRTQLTLTWASGPDAEGRGNTRGHGDNS